LLEHSARDGIDQSILAAEEQPFPCRWRSFLLPGVSCAAGSSSGDDDASADEHAVRRESSVLHEARTGELSGAAGVDWEFASRLESLPYEGR